MSGSHFKPPPLVVVYDCDQGTSYGGNGGGALHLVVADSLRVDGAILADGNPGYGYYNGVAEGGGGAGGSLWIETGAFSGQGTLSANGGSGNNTNHYDGGGGGGGRIALYAASDTFSGEFSATGGQGYQVGEPGTLWPAPVEIRGRVSNLFAPELTLANTTVALSAPGLGEWCSAVTDSNGNYTCPLITWPQAAGQDFVFGSTLSGDWGSRQQVHTVTLALAYGAGSKIVLPVDLPVELTTLQLQGSVVNLDGGGPLSDVLISVSGDASGQTTSDGDGLFTMAWAFPSTQASATLTITADYAGEQVITSTYTLLQPNLLITEVISMELYVEPGPQ